MPVIRGPRLTSERARLTALYAGMLLLAGCILLAVVYTLVQNGLGSSIGIAVTRDLTAAAPSPTPGATSSPHLPSSGFTGLTGTYVQAHAMNVITAAALNQLLTVSATTLVAFAVLSLPIAWWMAGRVLRPVGVIAATARKFSGQDLDQRIALKGPPGELKELADTFDEMLGRLEQLVTAQQRFAANAAHELRTPLAIQRAAVEIGLADPDPARVQWIRSQLIEVADTTEHLIESLLLLAATDQGLERREPVALDRTAETAVARFGGEARERAITITTNVDPTLVEGDPVLLTQLLRNLLSNALRYNHRGGSIHLDLSERTLTITNTGPPVPAGAAPHLFEPFRRLHERRHTRGAGAGLGLSIVASIAHAHNAEVTAQANPTGGLTVAVRFP